MRELVIDLCDVILRRRTKARSAYPKCRLRRGVLRLGSSSDRCRNVPVDISFGRPIDRLIPINNRRGVALECALGTLLSLHESSAVALPRLATDGSLFKRQHSSVGSLSLTCGHNLKSYARYDMME